MPIYLIKDEEYLDIQRCYEVYRKDDIRNIFDDVKDNCYQSIAISLFINSDDNLYNQYGHFPAACSVRLSEVL